MTHIFPTSQDPLPFKRRSYFQFETNWVLSLGGSRLGGEGGGVPVQAASWLVLGYHKSQGKIIHRERLRGTLQVLRNREISPSTHWMN